MKKSGILQFALAKGVGDVTIKKIIKFITREQITWDELVCDSEKLIDLGLKDIIIENIFASREQAMELSGALYSEQIEILVENEPAYPQHLKRMLGERCPPLLFVKGNKEILNSNSVGFCGSRKASDKGISIAANCAKQLAEKDITVVSGYASGIDMAAHRSALINSGRTVFVLAEGILRGTVKKDIKEILNENNHVFVSQFMPNVAWNAGNAMRRNSTIIGLSRAMILVESGRSGGTFAAGEEALRVGCPLFVIDFSKPEVSAEANPYFIEKGGMPIRGKNGIPSISKVFRAVNSEQENRNKIEQLKLEI